MVVNFKSRNKSFRTTFSHLVNDRIRLPEVRLIDQDGNNIGVIATNEALRKAYDQDLDLVVISEKAVPPVAKILDYRKFLYQEKKKKSGKEKSAKSDTKEFIFGPAIGDGDLNIRIVRTKEWLLEGNRVKMTVRLTGRQKSYPELGFEKLKKAIKELEEVGKIEDAPRLKGNLIAVTFTKK